ncbi:girdin-like [Dendropsophus ebraccatus]|uniref:girdin-like n=1 Tax=Dendropsophus ebraccatus TaxID=150705 RepID=UPI003832226F
MNPVDACQNRPKKGISIYQSDDFDSGFPSSNTSSCYGLYEKELKNELIRSEKRRSALADSLRNAQNAIEYQKNCLELQDQHIISSKSTLESLLMRQESLESRFSNLKHKNFYPDVLSLGVSGRNVNQSSRYPSEVTDNSRINALEREINDIKQKMRGNDYMRANNKALEIQEILNRNAELLEAKCSNAEQERDILELQIESLHSGLHQANITSKELEKKCVKLQSQIVANRNINESLHLEVSALKQHNHTLENAVKGSESVNKSLHVEVESLQKEKQILTSQKDLLFEIMKKKRNRKYHSEKLKIRTSEVIQTDPNSERNYIGSADGGSFAQLSQAATLRHSKRKRRRRKEKSRDSKDHNISWSDNCQTDGDRKYIRKEEGGNSRNKETQHLDEKESNVMVGSSSGNGTHKNGSKRTDLNTDIIVACYQHLADLLSKLECLKMNNVRLDNEKEKILKFLIRTIKDFQDCKVNSENSREKVEELLNERMGLRENYHKRINQVTAVIIELKHLRQAYDGLLRHSQNPDDRKAVQWISRVHALKDSLKIVLENQSRNPLPSMKNY